MNKPISLYLAGPIDLGTDTKNWRQYLIALLDAKGLTAVAFDPSAAFKTASWGVLDQSRNLFIEQINEFALNSCNFFIAMLPKNTPTIGTPIEINLAANNMVKHIFLVSDIRPGQSVYLDNRVDSANFIVVSDITSQTEVGASLENLADRIAKLSDTTTL